MKEKENYEVTSEFAMPRPERSEWGTRSSKYPFATMAVGDSFGYLYRNSGNIASAAHYHGKRHGKKFAVRKINSTLARIWRIK
jgi:hypothetical protein